LFPFSEFPVKIYIVPHGIQVNFQNSFMQFLLQGMIDRFQNEKPWLLLTRIVSEENRNLGVLLPGNSLWESKEVTVFNFEKHCQNVWKICGPSSNKAKIFLLKKNGSNFWHKAFCHLIGLKKITRITALFSCCCCCSRNQAQLSGNSDRHYSYQFMIEQLLIPCFSPYAFQLASSGASTLLYPVSDRSRASNKVKQVIALCICASSEKGIWKDKSCF
jgi:hypothetical protein